MGENVREDIDERLMVVQRYHPPEEWLSTIKVEEYWHNIIQWALMKERVKDIGGNSGGYPLLSAE